MIKINADRKVIENLPPHILSSLGMNQIAYVRHTEDDLYTVHAADGTEVSTFRNPLEAEDFIRLNNLTPITVH
ncbi:MAG: hypothetical protein H6857_01475 [Rhodospirillales bacterium]|nr:hypothetical protein [Rhodospirillales bacterium]